jgi:hypothetical protein
MSLHPDHGARSPFRGMSAELDTDERAARAYQHATRHAAVDLPDIRKRLDDAEQQIRVLMAIVRQLAGHGRPVSGE